MARRGKDHRREGSGGGCGEKRRPERLLPQPHVPEHRGWSGGGQRAGRAGAREGRRAALAKKREQERRDAEGAKRRAAYEQLKALEEAEAKKIEEDANRRADPNAPEKRHKPSGPPGGGLEIRRHPAEVEAEERAAAERAKAADVAAEELSKQTLQEQRKAKADDAKARYLARKKAAAAAP